MKRTWNHRSIPALTSSVTLAMFGADDEAQILYSASTGPVYTGFGIIFLGSALGCGGEPSSSPSRALPSGTIASAAGRGCQTTVASRQQGGIWGYGGVRMG